MLTQRESASVSVLQEESKKIKIIIAMAKKTEGKKVKRRKLIHKARRDMTGVSWEAREITANPDCKMKRSTCNHVSVHAL